MEIDIRILASSSSANCTQIDDGDSPILLDAGLAYKETKRRLDFQTSRLIGALITHSHKDHCRAVPDLLKAGIDCFMTAPTADALGVSGHRVRLINELEQFTVGPWTVLPFPTVHDAEGSVGFLVAHKRGAKVLYLTDTMYCRYRFSGLTHILIEVNHDLESLSHNVAGGEITVEHKARVMKTHMSLDTALGFLRANDLSRVREIYLIHLSDNNSDAERFKRRVMAATGKPVTVAGK